MERERRPEKKDERLEVEVGRKGEPLLVKTTGLKTLRIEIDVERKEFRVIAC